jgi:hypothetical protein
MKSPPENEAAGSEANLASGDCGKPSKSRSIASTKSLNGATALRSYVIAADLLVTEVRYG